MRAGSGAITAWQRLLDLAGRYDALRDAQLHLVSPLFGGGGEQTEDAFRRGGLLRNIIDIDPELQARASRRAPAPEGFVDPGMRAPWPSPDVDPGEKPGVWPTSDRPAYLRWLATGPAEPWCPTVAELGDKVREIAQWLRLGGQLAPPQEGASVGLDPAAWRREQRKAHLAVQEGEDAARASRVGTTVPIGGYQ